MKPYGFQTCRILPVPRRVPENWKKTSNTPKPARTRPGGSLFISTLFLSQWMDEGFRSLAWDTKPLVSFTMGMEKGPTCSEKRKFQTYDTRQESLESLDVDGNGHCTDPIAWWSDVDWEFADPKLWHSSMEDEWRVCAAGNTCNQGTPQVQSATTGWEAAAMDDGCRNNASINRPCSLRNSGGLHVENCGEQLCA